MAEVSPKDVVELRDLDRDLELGNSPSRSHARQESHEVNGFHAEEENFQVKVERSSNLARFTTIFGSLMKWKVGSDYSGRSDPETPRTPGISRSSQERFIKDVIGYDPRSDSLISACKWYISFLECKITEAWIQLFRPVLVGIDYKSDLPGDADIATAFEFFIAVVSSFGRKDLALVEIVDEAYNRKLLAHGDDERSTAHQLAFAAVGWISTLYSPNLRPNKLFLQIVNQNGNDHKPQKGASSQRNSRFRSKTFTTFQQPLDSKDAPLYSLLQRFGKVIPEHNSRAPNLHDPRNSPEGRNDGWIDPLLVCFHTLNKCTSIKIEWVDCLSLHLEFDSRTKILKMFRFPSFCLLMCCKLKKCPSLVSQIFENAADSNNDFSGPEIDGSREFFMEVLISYRLIFGQTKNSHRDFKTLSRKWAGAWNKTPELQKQADPMLYILCGQPCTSPEARAIYDEIEAEDPSTQYSPITDFPFFGERLVELQGYVRGHNFMALWYDRRDVSWWWTFWAVIIIGGATLIFALLQSILQIIQVVYAHEQVAQGRDLR